MKNQEFFVLPTTITTELCNTYTAVVCTLHSVQKHPKNMLIKLRGLIIALLKWKSFFTIVLQAFLHEGPKILAIIVKEIEVNWNQILVI